MPNIDFRLQLKFGENLLRLCYRFLKIVCSERLSAQVSNCMNEDSDRRTGMFVSSAVRTSTADSINKVGKVCQEKNGLLQL